jgi:eukaryotic-like serine/threonine-protein kinase
MGEVYRARDPRLGRDVALKVIHAAQATPERVERLSREARAAGALNHPNIVAVFDVGTEAGVPYVVSELLEGESLRQRLDRASPTYHRALEWGIQIAQALAGAHDKGICHRDVKPANVFITSDGRVKLLDFGLATLEALQAPGGSDDTTASAITRPGMIYGTVGYMAPEQVLCEAVDHRTDVFALGAVLYEMLTGVRAFQRPSAVETMNAVLKEEPPNPLDLNPALPPAAAAAVQRCLEKKKDERFQSARDLAFHLRQLEQATTGPFPRPRPGNRVRRNLMVASIVLAALAGALWAIWRLGVRARPVPAFQQLTFRRGRIGGARFAAGGVVYSQTREAAGPDVWFLMPLDSPESRRLVRRGADVLAVRPDKLALSFDRRFVRGQRFAGTLAVEPLGGGSAPRTVLTGAEVEDADWDPSGERLAVVRSTNAAGPSRVEYPLGQTVHETSDSIHSLRVSPDGQQVAFLEDPADLGEQGRVMVVGPDRRARALTDYWDNARGLAWSAGGEQIWFTAAQKGGKRALRVVDLKGRQRLVHEAPGSLTLWDVAPDGRVLLTRDDERTVLVGSPPGGTAEQDLSQFDAAGLASLSSDGHHLLSGDRFGAYMVPTNGDEPTPLGLKEAFLEDISPDRTQVLATTPSGDRILLQPTKGLSESQPLRIDGLQSFSNVRWFPDGQRILFRGRAPGRPERSYVMGLPDGPPEPLTAEGTWGLSISPDGEWVAAVDPGRGISCWRVRDRTSKPVPGSRPGDRPEAWSTDGRWLWVFRRGQVPTSVDRLEVSTGRRLHWKELRPLDLAGVYSIEQFRITPSGNAYFYSYRRILSELYVARGLR